MLVWLDFLCPSLAVLNGRVLGPLEGSGCSKRDESLLLIFCSSLKLVSFNSLPIARCLQFQKAIQFLGRDPFYTRIYSSVTLSPPDPLVLLSSPVVFLSISAPHLTSSVLRLLSQPVLYFSFFTLSFRWLQFWHLHYFKYFPHIRRIAQWSTLIITVCYTNVIMCIRYSLPVYVAEHACYLSFK